MVGVTTVNPRLGRKMEGGRKMFEPKCNAASFNTNVLHVVREERLKEERLKEERLKNGGSDERGSSGHG
tara:strand:+ start:236 stop:442 length:207 start_codon:yes stop_codon:yes gene_type:complete